MYSSEYRAPSTKRIATGIVIAGIGILLIITPQVRLLKEGAGPDPAGDAERQK